MAELTQFNIGQGETFRILLTINNSDTGYPIDTSDYTFAGQIRENYNTEEVAATFDIATAFPSSSGSVFIGLTSEETMNLAQRKYVYDINMTTTATNYRRRILEGYLTVRSATTR